MVIEIIPSTQISVNPDTYHHTNSHTDSHSQCQSAEASEVVRGAWLCFAAAALQQAAYDAQTLRAGRRDHAQALCSPCRSRRVTRRCWLSDCQRCPLPGVNQHSEGHATGVAASD